MGTPRTDRRLLRRSALTRHRRTGRAAPLVSKTADRGIVWPVLGAALAAVPATRRAGMAGVGAVAVTSAVTGVVQLVVPRDRPSRLTALVSRGSPRRPSSSSFPSTHAANAWAFAAATAMVRPALAVLLVPAAAAISGARVGIAHHYPSDVAAGAAVGVLVGSTVGVVLRRRSRQGRVPATDQALS